MTQSALAAIDRFCQQHEAEERPTQRGQLRPLRKQRGYVRRKRKVALGMKGRNSTRSVNQSMRSIAPVAN